MPSRILYLCSANSVNSVIGDGTDHFHVPLAADLNSITRMQPLHHGHIDILT